MNYAAVLLGFYFVLAVGLARAEHPLVNPYEGSVLRQQQQDAYNQYARILGFVDRQVQTEPLEGRLTRLRYDNPKGRSSLEIISNYRKALEAQGFVVDYECAGRDNCGSIARPGWNTINGMNVGAGSDVRYITGRMPYADGVAYVSVAVTGLITYLHILEAAQMETGKVVVDAAALAAGLERDGRIRVDGIYFDTGRASLKSDSDQALEQVAKLMRDRPDMRLFVVGHTDSEGSLNQNMGLSKARAEAVVAALVDRYSIAAGRLQGHGVGPLAPAATNRSDVGRTQNRRVEIVEQ